MESWSRVGEKKRKRAEFLSENYNPAIKSQLCFRTAERMLCVENSAMIFFCFSSITIAVLKDLLGKKGLKLISEVSTDCSIGAFKLKGTGFTVTNTHQQQMWCKAGYILWSCRDLLG